jgi:hypothetical protein
MCRLSPRLFHNRERLNGARLEKACAVGPCKLLELPLFRDRHLNFTFVPDDERLRCARAFSPPPLMNASFPV